MKKVVFDASFFLSFLLPDEESNQEIIKKFIDGNLTLIEPFLFNLEIINALRYAFTSKRIKKQKLLDIIKSFQSLENINYVYDFDFQKLAKLSLKYDISIYDACYVYIKEKTGLKLYSLDKKLMF